MWISRWRKSSRSSPQQIKWCALSFGIGRGEILQHLLEPRQSISSECSVSVLTMLNAQTSRVRPEKASCSMIMPHSIPIWRPLTVLAEQSCHNHDIRYVWHLWTFIFLGWWELYCVGYNNVSTTWRCGSPPLVQVFTSMKWRIFVITGENA